VNLVASGKHPATTLYSCEAAVSVTASTADRNNAVWVSDWDPDGAVIVLDSTTLTEIRRFANLQTPTGKFNVYNTAHDIY
jgi:hypothetical protein